MENLPFNQDDIFTNMGVLLALCYGNMDPTASAEVDKDVLIVGFIKNRIMLSVFRSYFEKFKKSLATVEPLKIPSVQCAVIRTENMNFQAKLEHFRLYGVSKVKLNKVEGHASTSTLNFTLSLPSLKITCDFSAKGKIKDKDIADSGKATIVVTNIKNFKGKVVVNLKEVQIKTLEFDFDYDNIEFSQTGLKVEGISEPELHKLLNNALKKYVITRKKEMCKYLADKIKEEINKAIEGKTLEELAELTKQ